MDRKDHLISWLNDAYSMEQALIPILENHAEDAKDHPELQRRIQRHVEETRRHAELVESCVKRLGEETSTTKNILGSMFGTMQSVATGMFNDELVKNALMDYATENFEIASYNALMIAATELGDQQTADVCREILHDEMNMADFLRNNMPTVVRETLSSMTA